MLTSFRISSLFIIGGYRLLSKKVAFLYEGMYTQTLLYMIPWRKTESLFLIPLLMLGFLLYVGFERIAISPSLQNIVFQGAINQKVGSFVPVVNPILHITPPKQAIFKP